MELIHKLKERMRIEKAPKIPLVARHVLLSAIASVDDDCSKPSERLLDITFEAVQRARTLSMANITQLMKSKPYFPEVWPGEHYKLLGALTQVLQPKLVIEIGTASGLSALAIKENLPQEGRLVTFDILPWKDFWDTVLKDSDFKEGKIEQILGDLSKSEVFQKYHHLFQQADLIFSDAPKDGYFEQQLMNQMLQISLPKKPLLVFDDIRLWEMLSIWRNITFPKIDITSFGHWSGTGIVDWQG